MLFRLRLISFDYADFYCCGCRLDCASTPLAAVIDCWLCLQLLKLIPFNWRLLFSGGILGAMVLLGAVEDLSDYGL